MAIDKKKIQFKNINIIDHQRFVLASSKKSLLGREHYPTLEQPTYSTVG